MVITTVYKAHKRLICTNSWGAWPSHGYARSTHAQHVLPTRVICTCVRACVRACASRDARRCARRCGAPVKALSRLIEADVLDVTSHAWRRARRGEVLGRRKIFCRTACEIHCGERQGSAKVRAV